MAIGPTARAEKNIWIAAGDGDLARVQELITQGLSPNVPDHHTYTPMHAAASYGHIHVLEFLSSHGGDVNITDEDGDTPLYTVENVETARWLVEHGTVVTHVNGEGVSPVDHLAEDFPEVAAYLRTVVSTSIPGPPATPNTPQLSHYAEERASERLTDSLMANAAEIMQRAEADGQDPEEQLRRLVSDAVLQGVVTGYAMGETASSTSPRGDDTDSDSKRRRTDEK